MQTSRRNNISYTSSAQHDNSKSQKTRVVSMRLWCAIDEKSIWTTIKSTNLFGNLSFVYIRTVIEFPNFYLW